jgi:hypothetical protein
MSSYNVLHASVTCPRCGAEVETSINCYFGYTAEMADLRIGNRYPWLPRKLPQNGGRPPRGTVDGKGYMECPCCRKDAFLHVLVRDDVITGIEPDPGTPGYIPD